MKQSNTKSGPGAAHIGFSMFGARGPLREEEGSGGSSPAPVAPTPAAPGEPAPAPGAPAEKLLPQSQVSTLIAEAKRETEAKTRARVLQEIEASKAPAPKPAATKSDGSMSAEDVQNLLARDRAFTRATAAAGLNDRQLTRMEAALKAENPPDVAAWSASYIEDLGLAKPVTPPPAAPAAPQQASEAPKPPTAPSAPTSPVSPTMQQGLVNLFALSEQQIAQLGPGGLREHFEAALSIGRQQAGVPQRPKAPARK